MNLLHCKCVIVCGSCFFLDAVHMMCPSCASVWVYMYTATSFSLQSNLIVSQLPFCLYLISCFCSFPELSYTIMQCGLDDSMTSSAVNRHAAIKYTHSRLFEGDEIFARVITLTHSLSLPFVI